MNRIFFISILIISIGCGVPKHVYEARKLASNPGPNEGRNKPSKKYELPTSNAEKKKSIEDANKKLQPKFNLVRLDIGRDTFVQYASTFIGVPYKYGGTTPAGMDCSGFVHRVFHDFGVRSPRSSRDYFPEGNEVTLDKAKRGDIILFQGSDTASKTVGHMGIIVDNKPNLTFIHSASGQRRGVMVSEYNAYWAARFVKVISVLK